MASSAAIAPSTHAGPLQIAGRWHAAIEAWLEAERDQLPLWLPVMLGAGVTLWFALPTPTQWLGFALATLGISAGALSGARGGRLAGVLAVAALAVVVGLGLAWWRGERVAAPVLAAPAIVAMDARVVAVEPQPARALVRLRLAPIRAARTTSRTGDASASVDLPPAIRVNLAQKDMPVGLATGAVIRLRARLMPPPQASVPGAYDYARVAWFDGIGATGSAFAPVTILSGARTDGEGMRQRLSRHIQDRVAGSAGGIAAALATGDTGAITQTDSDAMRRAGLAHLLSISGLHVTAVVGATMLLVLRLLALSPWAALRWRLPVIAAGAGAVAAIGYTLLTGSEVPTIRSCVAALLVLAAMALGREAVTLRLVAAGAVVVMALWPESLAGPSFQLSFAAVTALISLHEHPRVHGWFQKREESIARRVAREAGSLLLTGLVVELALMPIAVFHFHKEGVYGAVANILAIPLTTFVVMPAEALALVLDGVGLGAPLWWVVDAALRLLLAVAHRTADAPGSVAMLAAMPQGAFALTVVGGLWIALWRTRWRRLGVVPLVIGAAWALATPAPDLLVTGDGRHLGIRAADGGIAILRDRTGDYTRDVLAVNGGIDGAPLLLSDQPDARCSRDLCLAERHMGGRTWRVLATRSAYMVPIADLAAACRTADVVVSERRLPRTCRPAWLKLDRATLARTGGVAITFATGRITTVNIPGDAHPWRIAADRGHDDDMRDRSFRARSKDKPRAGRIVFPTDSH